MKIDWDLLHEQKLVLMEMRDSVPPNRPQASSLSGLIHLLDALQDEAVEQGRWAFPEEVPDAGTP